MTKEILKKFETIQKLQGSQAGLMPQKQPARFETIQKLQGSQAIGLT